MIIAQRIDLTGGRDLKYVFREVIVNETPLRFLTYQGDVKRGEYTITDFNKKFLVISED